MKKCNRVFVSSWSRFKNLWHFFFVPFVASHTIVLLEFALLFLCTFILSCFVICHLWVSKFFHDVQVWLLNQILISTECSRIQASFRGGLGDLNPPKKALKTQEISYYIVYHWHDYGNYLKACCRPKLLRVRGLIAKPKSSLQHLNCLEYNTCRVVYHKLNAFNLLLRDPGN